MAIVVNHNLPAMNANRMLNINNNALSKSLEKLSSGLKINRAADDASGLSISEKMRAQVRGLDQASANSEDGVSLIQTADGALDTTEQMLQRMRELTVKGTTETLADEDLQAITDEMKTLAEGINQIAERTEFNTKKLLTGNLGQTTVKATASFTADEATVVSGTNLTATAGKTVSAGTTVKLTAGYTTKATDSQAKIVGSENTTSFSKAANANLTAGSTIKITGTATSFTKAIQLEFSVDSSYTVDSNKQTISAGASVTTTGISAFNQTVKIVSDAGTQVGLTTGKKVLTAGTTISNLSTTAKGKFNEDVTVTANAAGGTVTVSAAATAVATISAGTTFTVGAAALTVNSGTFIDSAGGTTTTLAAGKTYTVAEGSTGSVTGGTNCSYAVNLGANQSITVSKGTAIMGGSDITATTIKTTVVSAAATGLTVEISAGGSFTVSAKFSIAADTTLETLVGTKLNTTAVSTSAAKINVKAGETITRSAGSTAITASGTYNVKILNDGTTASQKTNVLLSAGGTVTVTAGTTITAGTTFQLGTDKQFNTDAKVSGDKLTASAGTTITAGTSYDTNNDMVIQTGANAAQVTKFSIGNMAFSAITTNNTGADITKTDTTYGTAAVTYSAGASIVASAITTETACSQETLLALDVAINAVSTQRSKLGAVQNQLEYTIKNLDNTSENLSSAESRIRDTDMAKEMMNYTKYNILSQASQSMLAQANQQPQSVLSLLQ